MENPLARNSTPSGAYKFLSKRVLTMAGYTTAPTTFDAMLFFLPPFSRMTSRVVQLRNRLWELWSPNSVVHAFYPGLQVSGDYNGIIDSQPILKRCDGHLGRFDYTTCPQHYDPDRPWLGFIKKRCQNDPSPDNVAFLDVWEPIAPPNSGRFRLNFVHLASLRYARLLQTAANLENSMPGCASDETRPKRPHHLTVDGSANLRGDMTLDKAVDLLAATQRDFKELDAWNRMMRCITLRHNSQEPAPTMTRIPPADDTMIGVWLNGCDKTSGLWLLYNCVPCFIVHKADGDEEWRDMGARPDKCYTMSARTEISNMERCARNYERRFSANGQTFDIVQEDPEVAPYYQIPRSMKADRSRSSSYKQGWVSNVYKDPRDTVPGSRTPEATFDVEVDGKILIESSSSRTMTRRRSLSNDRRFYSTASSSSYRLAVDRRRRSRSPRRGRASSRGHSLSPSRRSRRSPHRYWPLPSQALRNSSSHYSPSPSRHARHQYQSPSLKRGNTSGRRESQSDFPIRHTLPRKGSFLRGKFYVGIPGSHQGAQDNIVMGDGCSVDSNPPKRRIVEGNLGEQNGDRMTSPNNRGAL